MTLLTETGINEKSKLGEERSFISGWSDKSGL